MQGRFGTPLRPGPQMRACSSVAHARCRPLLQPAGVHVGIDALALDKAQTEARHARRPSGRARQVNMLMSSKGAVLRCDVHGKIVMKVFLSGMPDVKLGLNDKLEARRPAAAAQLQALAACTAAPCDALLSLHHVPARPEHHAAACRRRWAAAAVLGGAPRCLSLFSWDRPSVAGAGRRADARWAIVGFDRV
jgi:hypothetical protein